MPTTIPSPTPPAVASDSTGLPDLEWVTRVRDALRDYPKYKTESWTADGTNGVVSWNAVPITVAAPPINDDSLTIRDTTGGVTYSVITTGVPGATDVLVDYDTGEIQWLAAPTVAHVIAYSYQNCKWRNTSISDALYAGLRAMFPRLGKTYTDTSISIQINVSDYSLPSWLQDPRARIIGLEIKDPDIPSEDYRPAMPGWSRSGLTQVHLPWARRYGPTARLRLHGWGPYLSLADLEPQLFHLPIWYALGVLLPKQESKRIREDQMVPLVGEGGQQPGLLTQFGDYFAKRFEQEVDRLSRAMGPGYNLPLTTTYQRR